jgi:pyruvate dehydrogenase (quinone)
MSQSTTKDTQAGKAKTKSSAEPAKVSDFLIARLSQWGVRKIYGYSGDGINGLLGALGRAGNVPEFIQPPHEELCAFMATAHAKYTGEVGVCLATQGPGAIHLLNGLYDAKLDHQPVVAIVGQVARSSGGSYHMQEVDLTTLFKDVAHEFVQVINTADQARMVIDRAFRIALAERTVTAIIVPQDVQELEAVAEPPHAHGKVSSSLSYSRPRVLPQQADLEQAAELLNAGKRVAMLVGAGALAATNEVIEVAERLQAGVAKALLGKAAVPDDLPFVTGTVGWLGTRASNRMMQECDTLLIVGSQFPYTEFLPAPGAARAVQIDHDGRALGSRYPSEVNLVGDSAETLRALLPLLRAPSDRTWRTRLEESVRAWHHEADDIAQREATPLNPARLFRELSAQLPDEAILCGDCGSATYWFGQLVQLRRGMKASLSGTLATMGTGVPYALTAKLNFPARPVIALVGDGAMQMNGINALITVAQHHRTWSDPRFVVLVLNNRDLSYVTWEQRVMEGNPKFVPSQALFDFPYARYAELLGLRGIRVDEPGQVADAWRSALSSDRPVVIEAITDSEVPPLPPELTEEQKRKVHKALDGGDVNAAAARRELAKAGKA